MEQEANKARTKEEAREALFQEWKFETKVEHVSLQDAIDRVSAEDIVAVNRLPVMRVSAVDGFAVRSEKFADGKVPDVSEWILHEDYEPAGIGDDFPDEFDSVISVEKLHFGPNRSRELVLEEGASVQAGENINPAGFMMEPGDLLVPKNTLITPELQANLAAGGVVRVAVIKKPIVAFIPTGNELIVTGMKPERGQNIDSNSYLISSYLRKWGAEPDCFPIAKDTTMQLEWSLDDALKTADIVILNGGSSKGNEDYNAKLLERRGSFYMRTVRTMPGRPVSIAMVNGIPVINMPGAIMAASVVADWLIRPMIAHFYGLPIMHHRVVKAKLTMAISKPVDVERYCKVHLERLEDGSIIATPLSTGKRVSELLRDGNGHFICPIGRSGYEKGEEVEVKLLVEKDFL